jgi:hypothetical protein
MMVDELLNPVLGLTPGPLAFPWQTHARGLGGHLAFGLTTELVLEGLDRAIWRPRSRGARFAPPLTRDGERRDELE